MSFREGWRDYLAGRSWPHDYDKWTWKRQLSYEEGRRICAALQGAGYKSPTFVQSDLPSRLVALVNDEKYQLVMPPSDAYSRPSSWRSRRV